MYFIDHFSALDDPRKDINIRYNFLNIVFLTVCAVVSGSEGWKDIRRFGDEKIEWLRQYWPYLSDTARGKPFITALTDGLSRVGLTLFSTSYFLLLMLMASLTGLLLRWVAAVSGHSGTQKKIPITA